MAKPPENAGSTAPRQIAPPPLSQHLRELASRPDAWAVLARNLIPGRRDLRFRLVRCARRVQLLVRWADCAGRNRRRADPARATRDTAEISRRERGGERCAWRGHVDFPRRHRRSAVLDRVDSTPRSAARQRAAPRARAFSGTLAHLRFARGRTFLEGVPPGLRRDARQPTEAAGALGCVS